VLRSRLAWLVLLVVLVAVSLRGGDARAQAAPPAKKSQVALLRIEPLGLDPELVERLEALFRLELERLQGVPLPARRDVDRVVAADAQLRGCSGETECLTAIGKKLGVAFMVTGTVAALGDSYVVNLKLVDVATGKEVRRVEEPLSGEPDELIEAVRVAAYRLFAPDKLKGAIAVLADVAGAQVYLDGKLIGKTPIAQAVPNLPVGKHSLRITASGYSDLLQEVEIRFQKTTQVVVNLKRAKAAEPVGPPGSGPAHDAPVPWYASTWGYVGVGVAAVALGVLIGFALSDDEVVDCGASPEACQ
jgi:hypothetical protein